LSRLNIGDNKLTLSGLQGMLEHLERNAYLKQLILDNNSLVGDSSSNFISIFLSSNTCLTHLSLKNCSVNQHIAESIAQGLRHNTRLHYLNLSKNPISDAGALNLARAFAEAPLSLKSLKMKRCALNDEGAKPLFDSLIKQTNLQYLDF
jgi:Ran GTPase-activating protein (RanGAP) involved in mRNA processing and transport